MRLPGTKKNVLAFASSGNRNATLDDKKAGTASFEHCASMVETVKIDDITCGRTVDYIKYDTEGAERAALEGSSAVIEHSKPSLRISAFARYSGLPPNFISVPLPAILVEMVTAPGHPAWAIISASLK